MKRSAQKKEKIFFAILLLLFIFFHPLSAMDAQEIMQDSEKIDGYLNQSCNNLEKEILPQLPIEKLAQLLLDASAEEAQGFAYETSETNIKDFLVLAINEFAKRLKQDCCNFEAYRDFTDRLFSAVGKLKDIDWKAIVVILKGKVRRSILTENELKKFRISLKRRLGKVAGPINQVDCFHDGNILAICGKGANEGGYCDVLRVDGRHEGLVLRELRTKSPVNEVSFFDDSLFFGFADDQSLLIKDLVGSRKDFFYPVYAIDKSPGALLHSIAFSRNHNKIAARTSSGVTIIDAKSQEIVCQGYAQNYNDNAVRRSFLYFVPSSPVLIDIRSLAAKQLIRLWHTESGACLLEKDFHNDFHEALIKKYCCTDLGILWVISDTGVLVRLDCNLDCNGRLKSSGDFSHKWDTEEARASLWEQSDSPLCFDSEGKTLLLAYSKPKGVEGRNKGVIVRILDDPAETNCKHGAYLKTDETTLFEDACFGRDSIVATLDREKKVMLWNATDGSQIAQLASGVDRIFCFSPDGEYLLACVADEPELFFYSSKKIARYLSEEISLEQALAILYSIRKEEIPQEGYLGDIIRSLNFEKIGFLFDNSERTPFCIDSKDSQGKTPLYYAAENANKASVELLIANGASKKLAYDHACDSNNDGIIKLLEETPRGGFGRACKTIFTCVNCLKGKKKTE